MKKLVYLFAGLIVLLGGMVVHYTLTDRTTPDAAFTQLVAVMDLDAPAYGAAWYAPRSLRRQSEALNPAYPELTPILRSEYVYAH